MRILSFLFLLWTAQLAVSQPIDNYCTAPGEYEESSRESAAQLALQRLFDINSPDTTKIRIDEASIDTISSALNAIYNLDIPSRFSDFSIAFQG